MGTNKYRLVEGMGDYLTNPDECWDVQFVPGIEYEYEAQAISGAVRRYDEETTRIAKSVNRHWWKSYWVFVTQEDTLDEAIRVMREEDSE